MGESSGALTSGDWKNSLPTVAEASGFEKTSRYVDVQSFISRLLAAAAGRVRLERIATSVEGRDVPLMIIGAPPPESPADLKDDYRIVVYLQANIHAGEVEGKEAALMLARDLAAGEGRDVLARVVVLICPNFNPDGNEAISAQNRPHQNGPKGGVGLRYNGQMLDLNRDAMKIESPEMAGLIENVIRRWDPAVTVDCHTTNGSFHEEPVTFTWMMNPAGERGLIEYMRDKMMPGVSRLLAGPYKTLNCFYGEFVDHRDPGRGWIDSASEPRYLVNYLGLRNRLAVLNENYVYADFETRVRGCYRLLRSILDYAAVHAAEIAERINRADARTAARGCDPTAPDMFPIQYDAHATPEPVTVRAFEADVATDDRGRERLVKSDRQSTVTVPYLVDYRPTYSVPLPFAYLIAVRDARILETLSAHGIRVDRLLTPQTLEVEEFRIDGLKPAPRLNQGHYCNTVSGAFSPVTREFSAGTCVVQTAQCLANLAAYLLEPQTNDSLLFWNFFDRYLVPQWGRRFHPYPVYKLLRKTELRTE